MKVSAQSNTKQTAGKIAHDVRDTGKAPTLLTIGSPSINQAMKVRLCTLVCTMYGTRISRTRPRSPNTSFCMCSRWQSPANTCLQMMRTFPVSQLTAKGASPPTPILHNCFLSPLFNAPDVQETPSTILLRSNVCTAALPARAATHMSTQLDGATSTRVGSELSS